MNGTSETSLEEKYIFLNGKWTTVVKPVRVTGDDCPVSNRGDEMTADQVSKGIPDDLLSSDTCVIQSPPAIAPSVHEESSHALEQHGQTLPNAPATMLVPGLVVAEQMQATDVQEKVESGNVLDLVLIQTPVQNTSVEPHKLSTSDVTDPNVAELAQIDLGINVESMFLSQTGQQVRNDGDITVGCDHTMYLNSNVSDMSEGNSIAKPVVPMNVMSQDVVDDYNVSYYISESEVLSKTISTGLTLVPEHHDIAPETVMQSSFDKNDLDLISTNQETKDICLGIAPCAFQPVSNTSDSMQTKDALPTKKRGSLCNVETEESDVILTDPVISGLVWGIVHNNNLEIIGIAQENICQITSEINELTEERMCNTNPETGDTVDIKVHSTDSETSGIAVKIASHVHMGITDIGENVTSTETTTRDIVGDTSHKHNLERSARNTPQHTNSEITGFLEDISRETADIRGDTVCNIKVNNITRETNPNPQTERGTLPKTICNIGSEMGYIVRDTTCVTVAKTVHNNDCEIKDSVGEPKLNTDAEINDTIEEAMLNSASEIHDVININRELPMTQEPFSNLEPSAQVSSLDLNDNSMLVMDSAILNPKGLPADSLVDSTAKLLENVLTQTPQNLVTESNNDMIGSEEPMPARITIFSTPTLPQLESIAFCSNDSIVDNKTKNNSDTHFRLTNSLIKPPDVSEESETNLPFLDLSPTPAIVQDIDLNSKCTELDRSETTDARYSRQLSNELWKDTCHFEEDNESIFDEWGHSPGLSPPRATPDNTKSLDYSLDREAVIGQLVNDWELSSVKRWSSSDSWASALSDWFQSVYVEDSPLSATTASCRNLTDHLPYSCMAVQDIAEEHRGGPGTSSTTGQVCLSPSPTEAVVDSHSRRETQNYNSDGPVLQPADEDVYLNNPSYSSRIKGSAECVDCPKERNTCISELGSLLQKEKVESLQPRKAKPDDDKFWEVTEDRTSKPLLDFDGKSARKRFSGYPSQKDLTPGPCLEKHTSQRDKHVPFEPEHLTRPQGVETHCLETSHNSPHVCVYTQDSDTVEGKCRGDDPLFIMPFAPVCIGPSFHHICDLKEDQPSTQVKEDQHFLKPSLLGTVDKVREDCKDHKSGGKPTSGEESSDDQYHTCSEKSHEQSSCGDSEESSSREIKNKIQTQKPSDISSELSKLILLTGQRFMVSEGQRVAYATLDLDDVLNFNKDPNLRCDKGVSSFLKQVNCEEKHCVKYTEMPHKTTKTSTEGKAHKERSKHKDKMTSQQLGIQTKKQEQVQPEMLVKVENESLGSKDGTVTVIETIVITEKITPKIQSKKKKKHGHHGTVKPESEPLAEVENVARPKAKSEKVEAILTPKTVKVKEKPILPLISTINTVSTGSPLKDSGIKQNGKKEEIKANIAKAEKITCDQEPQITCPPSLADDDIIKRRRISGEKTETVPIRTRPQLPAIFRQRKDDDVSSKRAYSDVVKQKILTPKEVPCVLAEIQAAPVLDDPQSISLWCQFSSVAADSSVTWSKEGKVLSEKKRGVNDVSRVTLSILKACSKDLGMYRCRLTSSLGSVSTSDYHLTSEVLMEMVIPSHDTADEHREVDGEEEDVHCALLLFRDDFLTDQYFGENQSASIVTEKDHFGEGMHRKAFRTTLLAGMPTAFNPGHSCVLKVHNAISYGTKNNDELVQKNYTLAVEECHVQNTAREYIKAYMNAAKSTESFGEVPEIIPIYLVHRPSSDIPYATLEEELIGDFVKYSVRDGKEINLMRRDSEAGQKCCAFQHWVYTQTDGNLLVTDMQGVGMKLTDVGIATCKKGYRGFKGNCATSFIDQFKALHQCNRFCELLGLTSLQPKPKRTVNPPKPKTQPVPKKKTFGPIFNSKS